MECGFHQQAAGLHIDDPATKPVCWRDGMPGNRDLVTKSEHNSENRSSALEADRGNWNCGIEPISA
jgi:hypothetical protein